MGAVLSKLWSDFMRRFGVGLVQSSSSPGYARATGNQMDTLDESVDQAEYMDAETTSQDALMLKDNDESVGSEGFGTPEKSTTSPSKLVPSSPLKSTWEENSDRPNPTMEKEALPAEKKTKLDEKGPSESENIRFEPVPDLHFGQMHETYRPESLAPSATESDSPALTNGWNGSAHHQEEAPGNNISTDQQATPSQQQVDDMTSGQEDMESTPTSELSTVDSIESKNSSAHDEDLKVAGVESSVDLEPTDILNGEDVTQAATVQESAAIKDGSQPVDITDSDKTQSGDGDVTVDKVCTTPSEDAGADKMVTDEQSCTDLMDHVQSPIQEQSTEIKAFDAPSVESAAALEDMGAGDTVATDKVMPEQVCTNEASTEKDAMAGGDKIGEVTDEQICTGVLSGDLKDEHPVTTCTEEASEIAQEMDEIAQAGNVEDALKPASQTDASCRSPIPDIVVSEAPPVVKNADFQDLESSEHLEHATACDEASERQVTKEMDANETPSGELDKIDSSAEDVAPDVAEEMVSEEMPAVSSKNQALVEISNQENIDPSNQDPPMKEDAATISPSSAKTQHNPGPKIESPEKNFDSENIDPNRRPMTASPFKSQEQVTVHWTGPADEVCVTGSWTNWSEKVHLQKTGDDHWSVTFDLARDLKEVEMKFIVDGNWVTSPDMPWRENEEGIRNNYISLGNH